MSMDYEYVPIWNFRNLPGPNEGRSWAAEQGLIPTVCPDCPTHRCPTKLYLDGVHGLGRFQCNKKGCNRTKAVAKGTWFEEARLPPWQVAYLMYGFAHDLPLEDIRRETCDLTLPPPERIRLGQETIVAW